MREKTAGRRKKRLAGKINGKRRKETAGGEKKRPAEKKRQAGKRNGRQGKTAAGEKTVVLMRGSRNKRLEKYHIL